MLYRSGGRIAFSYQRIQTLLCDEIRSLISTLFLGGDKSIAVANDLDLTAAGICDSFALLELAVAIEKKMSLSAIPDSDVTVDNFGSIDRIVSYLRSHAD